MTPLPDANDAPDSLLSSTTSDTTNSAGRKTENTRLPSRFSPEDIPNAPTSIGSSSRSNSRPSRANNARKSYEGRRSPSSHTSLNSSDATHNAILGSFIPRVAVLASDDTNDIAREKGVAGGFYGLLRPFGERVPGKVVVRDSVGASKSWDDFSIRLVQYGADLGNVPLSVNQSQLNHGIGGYSSKEQNLHSSPSSTGQERRDPVDDLLEHYLPSTRPRPLAVIGGNDSPSVSQLGLGNDSPTFDLYLRKLLSGTQQVSYETFTHPTTCIIVVSSRSQGPLEEIRQLYSTSGRSNINIPPWVGVDYLRYYVLVHDEDKDDIARSTALFDLMKRHFGLHCYLLRLRSVPCMETDDDSVRVPPCVWMSPDEEIERIRTPGPEEYVFQSDAAAMKSFIREVVTQSIVPFMEGRIVTWDDQVASKRRGIGGRFMSLSKRWTTFGASKASSSAAATASNSNFDPVKGYYPPESPEVTMRQLGDYAFMLRDFKLAFTTYDSIRTDFSTDKAWLYHASATELACVSYLLIPQTLSNRSRSEMIDQKLDSALYSYLTRSSLPFGAVRSVLLVAELLRGRGAAAAEDAANWATKLLDLGILSPLQQALLTERIADIHHAQDGSGSLRLGSRKRQAVLWDTLASVLWRKLEKLTEANYRLRKAGTMMGDPSHGITDPPFPAMRPMYAYLLRHLGEAGDKKLIDFGAETEVDDVTSINNEMHQRLDEQSTNGEVQSTDANGFFTIEASHPGFKAAQSWPTSNSLNPSPMKLH
ncbi:MAG: hypothetical protein Q9207_007355 [Kuettlingeria erythrocarpa]